MNACILGARFAVLEPLAMGTTKAGDEPLELSQWRQVIEYWDSLQKAVLNEAEVEALVSKARDANAKFKEHLPPDILAQVPPEAEADQMLREGARTSSARAEQRLQELRAQLRSDDRRVPASAVKLARAWAAEHATHWLYNWLRRQESIPEASLLRLLRQCSNTDWAHLSDLEARQELNEQVEWSRDHLPRDREGPKWLAADVVSRISGTARQSLLDSL